MHLLAPKGVLHSWNMNEKNPWRCLIKFHLFLFLFWERKINHPILHNFRNFDFKAIMVLIRKKKKKDYCNLIDFPFLLSSYRFYSPPRLDAFRSNISITSARVSSGFTNTRKLARARGHRLSVLIVFECLETLLKPDGRVF